LTTPEPRRAWRFRDDYPFTEGIGDFIADVMSGKQAIRTALTDASTRIQQVLDKWKR
jgi:hypothetical protein